MMQEALLEAYKQTPIGLLCSGIIHNINSPLAAIILTAEVAHAKHPDLPELADILKAAERIQEIVENLGAKCADEQTEERVELNLNELVQRELAFLQADLFLKHQVSVETKLQEDLPAIHARYVDFSFALFCIVQNALDAMQDVANPKLFIATGREDETTIWLAVRDCGAGMDPQIAGRIFEPFFSASTVKERSTGQFKPKPFGLGLPLAQRALESYRVKFKVKSGPGTGTTITLGIPLNK